MRYDFSDAYMLNKKSIERGTNFDRSSFFSDLQVALAQDGFRQNIDYFIGDEGVNEGLCLYEDGEFWVVSYLERGIRFSPAFFVDPYEAGYFLQCKLSKRRKIHSS